MLPKELGVNILAPLMEMDSIEQKVFFCDYD